MPRAVVHEVLVNLVCDQEQIALDGKLGYGFELRQREDLPARITGSVE